MAQRGAASNECGLLAMIVDQDTATGMLLTGVGHVDLRRRSNFLVVDDSKLMKAQYIVSIIVLKALAEGAQYVAVCLHDHPF